MCIVEFAQPIESPKTVLSDNQAALSLLAEKWHTKMSKNMEPIDSRLRSWVSEKRLCFTCEGRKIIGLIAL